MFQSCIRLNFTNWCTWTMWVCIVLVLHIKSIELQLTFKLIQRMNWFYIGDSRKDFERGFMQFVSNITKTFGQMWIVWILCSSLWIFWMFVFWKWSDGPSMPTFRTKTFNTVKHCKYLSFCLNVVIS